MQQVLCLIPFCSRFTVHLELKHGGTAHLAPGNFWVVLLGQPSPSWCPQEVAGLPALISPCQHCQRQAVVMEVVVQIIW